MLVRLVSSWLRRQPTPTHPLLHEEVAGKRHDAAFARRYFGSPHRLATWLLTLSTLVALSVAALVWTTALAGRWTILSGTSVLATFLTLLSQGFFRINMVSDGTIRLRLAGSAAAIGVTAGLVVTSLPGLDQPRVPAFVSLMVLLLIAGVASRMAGRGVIRSLWRRGFLRANALVYGADELAREMAIEINLRRGYGVDVVGFAVEGRESSSAVDDLDVPVVKVDLGHRSYEGELTPLDEARRWLKVDRLIVGPSTGGDDAALRVARWASAHGLPVHAVPRFYKMGMGFDSMSPDRARGYPLVRLQRAAHPQVSIRLKRLLDIVVASSVLVLCAPIMALAALAVRLTSDGPVLFAQERVGRDGRLIMVRKFRSMKVSSASDTEWNADQRVTAVGRWLRRSNVDELPQLFTILAGDMSLVGPRPERPVFVERFSAQIPDYADRHRMPVGLTGLAQVVGLRGDTSIAERVKYDNLYIDQWSLRVDVEILLRTVLAVVTQRADARRAVELADALENGLVDLRSRGTDIDRKADQPVAAEPKEGR